MIKVIIADDEPLLLRSLKMNIESLDPEYEVIGQATNGQMALEMAEQMQPDIIFTDIKMPIFDGLQFAAAIRDKKISSKIVLISGYQEFEYAKKAITLGVEDYLVKPVNPVVLSELLQNMKKQLKKTLHEGQLAYLQELIHGGRIGREDNVFGENKRFYIAYICLGTYISYRNNQFQVSSCFGYYKNILEALDQELGEKKYWILDGKFENEKLIVGQCVSGQDQEFAEAIYRLITERCSLSVTLVYGTDIYNAEQLREKLLETGLILKKKIIFSQSQCIFTALSNENSSQEQTGQISPESMDYWKQIVKNRESAEIEIFLKNQLSECRKKGFSQVKLTEILRKYYFLLEQQVQGHFEGNMLDLTVTISQNYNELEDNVLQLFRSGLNLYEGQNVRDSESVHTMETIKSYIDYNYTEKLSIMEIAEKFGFNYTYLCTGFKRYFGETPNDYIIKKRIDKAKILFDTEPVLNIKEVAMMIGYDNPYYFSRIFKSVTEMTPSQYKKKSNKFETKSFQTTY